MLCMLAHERHLSLSVLIHVMRFIQKQGSLFHELWHIGGQPLHVPVDLGFSREV